MALVPKLISATGRLANKIEIVWSISSTITTPPLEPVGVSGVAYGMSNIPANATMFELAYGYGTFSTVIPSVQNGTYYVWAYVGDMDGPSNTFSQQMFQIEVVSKGYELSSDGVAVASPLIIANGTEGINKTLYSDPSGNVSWKEISSISSSKRYIGELYGGGVVADIWNEGGEEVALIASLEDLKPLAGDFVAASNDSEETSLNRFSSFFYKNNSASQSHYVGTYSQSNYDGFANTQAILQSAALYSATGSAAEVAASHRGGGYDDWYLPSYYELNAIYKNSNAISKSLSRDFMFPIRSYFSGLLTNQINYLGYWSSTEVRDPNGESPGIKGAYRIWVVGRTVFQKGDVQRIKAVRKEYSKAVSGLVLSLDATREDSFSEASFYLYGTASRWSCLVNQHLSNAYRFNLGSVGSISGTYQGMPGADTQISSFASLGQSIGTSGKISVFTFTNVNTTDSTKVRLFNSAVGAPSSIVSDYVLISLEQAELFFTAANSSAVGNPVANAALLRVYASEILPSGQPSQYRIVGEILPTSSKGYRIPLWQFKGKRVSVKIEAPYGNATNVSGLGLLNGGPSVTNLVITGYNGYRALGPSFIPEQGGYLRLSTTQSLPGGGVGGSGTGSYIDFYAPIADATTATIEMWARLNHGFSDIPGGSAMMFSFGPNQDVWIIPSGIGYNTYVSDLYGVPASVVNSKGAMRNWTHFVFEMKAGSELGPTPSFYSNNKIYINGERQDLSQITGNPTFSRINFNGGFGRIGGSNTINRYLANMDLSVFRIYNRALSKDEIMLNFESERKRYEIVSKVHKDDLWVDIDFNNPSSYSGTGMANESVTDLSGKGNTASIVAGTSLPTVFSSGTAFPIVKRMVFPGATLSNPALIIPDVNSNSTELRDTTVLSVCFWVKFSSSRESTIVSKWNNFQAGFEYRTWSVRQYPSGAGSTIGFSFRQFTTYTVRIGTKVIPNNTWTHVCLTYNNATKNVRSYINSVPDISEKGRFLSFVVGPGPAYVGGDPFAIAGVWSPLHGEIANVQIYTREMSRIEATNIFNTQNFRFDSTISPVYGKSHLINTSPTFSIYQNLQLDIPGRYSDRILTSRANGDSVWADKKYVFSDKKDKKRKIGDLYGGGIIVGTWKYPSTTNNYLIMSLQDLTNDAGVPFSNVTSTAVGAYSEYDGAVNSAAIITQAGHSTSAAKLCDNYSANGYTDWYLPSAQEMMMAFNAGEILGYVIGKNEFAEYGFDLPRGKYWTSTEPRETDASNGFAPFATNHSIILDLSLTNDTIYQKYLKSLPASVRAFRVATELEERLEWPDSWDPSHVPIDWRRPSWATKVSLDPNFKFLISPDGYDTNPIGSGTISAVAARGSAAFTFSNVISTTEAIISAGVCWATSSTYPIIPTIDSNVAYASPPYSVVGTGPILGNPAGYLATVAQAREASKIFRVDVPNTIDKITGYPETPFRIFIRAFVRTDSGYYYSKDTSRVMLASRSVNGGLSNSLEVMQEISAATYSANGTTYAYPEGVMSYIHSYYYYNRN